MKGRKSRLKRYMIAGLLVWVPLGVTFVVLRILIDLMDRRIVDVAAVGCAVLDEADQMADMGFLPQVHAIMRHFAGSPQVMLFSATLDGAV